MGLNKRELPAEAGHSGEYLTTNGTVPSWSGIVPSTTFLKLDQTTPQSVINGSPIFDLGIQVGTGTDALVFNTLQSMWAFKYASGLGFDDTGLYFNTGTSCFEYQVLGNAVFSVNALTQAVTMSGDLVIDLRVLDNPHRIYSLTGKEVSLCNSLSGGGSLVNYFIAGSDYIEMSATDVDGVLQSTLIAYPSGEIQMTGVRGAVELDCKQFEGDLENVVDISSGSYFISSSNAQLGAVGYEWEGAHICGEGIYLKESVGSEVGGQIRHALGYVIFKANDAEAYHYLGQQEIDGVTHPFLGGQASDASTSLLFKDVISVWESSPGSGAALSFVSNDLLTTAILGYYGGEIGYFGSGKFAFHVGKTGDPEVVETITLSNVFLGVSTVGDGNSIIFKGRKGTLFGNAFDICSISSEVTNTDATNYAGVLNFYTTDRGASSLNLRLGEGSADFQGLSVNGGTVSSFGTATDYWTFSEVDFGMFGKLPLLEATGTFLLGSTFGAIADYLIIYDNSDIGFPGIALVSYGLAGSGIIDFDGSAMSVDKDWLPKADTAYNLGSPDRIWSEIYVTDIFSTGTAELGVIRSDNYQNSTGDESIVWADGDDWWEISNDFHPVGDIILTPGVDIKPVTNSTTALNIAQADGTAFVTFDTTNKLVGINRTPAIGKDLDLLGKFRMSSSLSDNVAKYAYFTVQHYDIEDSDVLGFLASSEAAQNKIVFGGGSAQYNCMTDVYFYTAADASTVSGTSRLHINNQGNFGLGTSANNNYHFYLYTAGQITDIYGSFYAFTSKASGATNYNDTMYGIRSYYQMNQSGGEIGHFYGIHNTALLSVGTVGEAGANAKSMYGLFSTCQMDGGTVTGSAYGGYVFCDLNGSGTISGNAYGLYIDQDIDGTLTGDAFMLYLNQRTNVDYALYHNGTAPSKLGGCVGIGVDPATTAKVVILDASLPQLRLTHTAGVDTVDFQLDGDSILWISPQASTGAVLIDHKLVQTGITVTAAGPTDNVDVSGCNIVWINTSANDVTIGGFVGGYDGQIIHVVIEDATNTTKLEYAEGTGNQDIYLAVGVDETRISHYGGWTLACNGTNWYEVDNSQA